MASASKCNRSEREEHRGGEATAAASHDESRKRGRASERARSFRSFVRFLPAANQFHAELRSGGGGEDGDDDRIVFIAIATAERGEGEEGEGLAVPQAAGAALALGIGN